MSSIRNRGLVLAMEDDEVNVPVEEVMVPETEKEVEVASTEVSNQESEIAEVVTAVEEAETDAETLGDIQEVMAETVESGEGVDETTAAVAEVAVEAICARLGIKNKQSVIPATESFGQKGTKLAATKIALENISETISKIWKAIMAALKQVWEKIKSFFVGLVKNRTLLLKHLESLKAKVAGIDAAAEQAEKELKGGVAKAFSINGKASFATAEKIMDDSVKLINAINIGAAHSSDIAGKLIDIKAEPASLDGAAVKLLDNIRASVEPLGKVDSATAGKDGAIVAHYGNLAYGKSVGINYTEGEKTTVSLTIEENTKLAETAEALTKEQMGKLLDQAIALIKNLQNVEKSQKDVQKIAKACDDVTSAVLKGAANMAAGDGKDEAAKKESATINKAAANIRSLNSMVAKFGASMPSSVFQAGKAAGDYVTASANNFKAKKEEAAKAE